MTPERPAPEIPARYVGRSVRSKEAPRHVTGRGQFTNDYRLPGLLHGAILRTPHPHARLVRVSADRALAHPGVVAVLTPADVKAMTRPFSPGRYAAGLRGVVSEYATAMEKVRYVGEPVAAVAAQDAATAEDALELITVEYEPLPAVVETAAALKPDAPPLFDELGSNTAWQGGVSYGDVERAFQEADRIVREQLKLHRYSSIPLETFACIAAADPLERGVTVWCNAQAPEVIYDALRDALGLTRIRIVIPDIGGGFGQKIHLIRKYVLITALLSLRSQRPVKWIEDRSEHMMAAGQSCGQEFDIEAAVKGDGRVLALRVRETDDVGGSVSTATIHFTNKLNNLVNTYTTRHISLEGRSVVTNKCPVVPNRGIGKPGMCFIWERTMDRIAAELGMSPVAVRTANLIRSHQFPYETPSGNIYDSGDYEGLVQKALELIEKEGLRDVQRRAREQGRFVGIGVAMGVEPGGRNAARDMAIFPSLKKAIGSGGVNGATIRLERSGAVSLLLGTPSCGQSHETTTAQVVADILEITPEQVTVVTPFDSELSPWGSASANSGNNFHLYDIEAARGAALRLREKIVALAGHLLRAPAQELRLSEGTICVRGSAEPGLTFADLVKVAHGHQVLLPEGFEPGMQATFFYKFPHAEPYAVPDAQGRVRAQFTFSAAVHLAMVEVDAETGSARVMRYVIVSDNGTIINPSVVEGQVFGSAVHGISVSLGAGFVYAPNGAPLTLTLTDYGIPTPLDAPPVEVVHHPVPSPFTTFGQKAAGEGASIPSPAAIASAVEDALSPLGIHVQELPLTSEAVWRLLTDAKDRSNGGTRC
jgi:2-furoyl-CoA dehydrogenase large subunit